MANIQQDRWGFVESRADFGRERRFGLRFNGGLWLEIGAGVSSANVMVQAGAVSDDVSVQIERLQNGFEVSMHGILQGEEWGLPQNAPRLRLTVDDATNVASIHAAIGSGVGYREILLDQMNMNS